MRLATFNILHGRSLSDGQVSPERLVEACASLDVDVLCLQEIDRGQPRSGHVDQTAAIAAGMDAVAWRFEPAIVGEPGGTWRPATGDPAESDQPGYGVAIVSRLPVVGWHVVRLGAAPVRSPVYVPATRRFVLLPDEPRLAVVADLGKLNVASTHLSFVPAYNLLQLRRLTAQLPRPCVLLGDLNVPGPLPSWMSRWRPLVKAPTFPAANPRFQVDHVLASDTGIQALSGEAKLLPVSDHRALTVELASGRWPCEP